MFIFCAQILFLSFCLVCLCIILTDNPGKFNPLLCFPHQALSASLTQDQKYLVDRLVEAHRLYRAQDSSHSRVGHSEQVSAEETSSVPSVLMAAVCLLSY